ncbi:hypothetical protein MSIMFB_05113 [Mycobacterium simulans]|uniref:Integrase catalytic domain-containing protein n=1 Tax=Mycobacterium simulans TaxID=627089 RepID=A0A7Z7IS91_9MYCO|nr:hypothetical protein MSIMFB_05113 [Mycobacterium simulans]
MSVAEKDALLVSLTGLETQYIQEDVMVQGSDLSRGNYYNNQRRHSAIGMLSPISYEQSLNAASQAA